jgi:hypothetical protein
MLDQAAYRRRESLRVQSLTDFELGGKIQTAAADSP